MFFKSKLLQVMDTGYEIEDKANTGECPMRTAAGGVTAEQQRAVHCAAAAHLKSPFSAVHAPLLFVNFYLYKSHPGLSVPKRVRCS